MLLLLFFFFFFSFFFFWFVLCLALFVTSFFFLLLSFIQVFIFTIFILFSVQTNDHGLCHYLQGASHVEEVCSLREQKVGLEQEVGQLKAELQTRANLVCQDL